MEGNSDCLAGSQERLSSPEGADCSPAGEGSPVGEGSPAEEGSLGEGTGQAGHCILLLGRGFLEDSLEEGSSLEGRTEVGRHYFLPKAVGRCLTYL